MSRTKEIWREYPLDYDYEGFYKVEVSNRGEIKTYNSLSPEGKIANGTLQGGFPILRIKLFKKRSDADVAKLELLRFQIDDLNSRIKSLKYKTEEQQEKLKLRKTRDELVQKRKKLNQRIDRKRCLNIGILKHKAVAELFLDPPADDSKKFIIHKDFNKENNAVENLAWASQEELNDRYMKHPKNINFSVKKQLNMVKPNTGSSKLSETEVLTIKQRIKKGDSLKKLASRFHVTDMQIHRIKTGENWGHVKLLEELLEEKDKKKWQAT